MALRVLLVLLCAYSYCGAATRTDKITLDGTSHVTLDGASHVAGTCEEKVARGDDCQVILKLDDKSTTLQFDDKTTLADLHKRVQKWIATLGGREVNNTLKVPLAYRGAGSHFKVLNGPDDATLLSLGVEDSDSVPNTIMVSKGALLGGVMYGTQVNPQNYDFVVNIFYHPPGKGNNMCTGTIYDRYILTAAHCLYNRDPKDFHIILAHVPYTERSFTIKNMWTIPGYDNDYGAPDVGIIEVNGAGYIPNAKVSFSDKPTNGAKFDCYLAGFGISEHGGKPAPDRPLVVGKFRTNTNCRLRRNRDYFACAASPDYTAGCGGDSGGPWFQQKSHFFGKTENIIFGVHHGSQDCDPNRPNKYDTSEIMLLAESVNFWGPYFPH